MSRGYTLLEILIATTILVIGLAAVFGVTQAAQKKSVAASELAMVQLACQTMLNERLADQSPLKPSTFEYRESLPPHWKSAVNIYPSPKQGLYVVQLTAQKFALQGDVSTGIPFYLIRWVPQYRVELPRQSMMLDETQEFDDPYR